MRPFRTVAEPKLTPSVKSEAVTDVLSTFQYNLVPSSTFEVTTVYVTGMLSSFIDVLSAVILYPIVTPFATNA